MPNPKHKYYKGIKKTIAKSCRKIKLGVMMMITAKAIVETPI